MLLSAKKTQGHRLHARDGEIGRLQDLYFDDISWQVRYLVVELGNWFSPREVLLSPSAIGHAVWDGGTLHLQLTRRQIADSPDVDTHLPVSRQHEEMLAAYYGWPIYWTGPVYTGMEPLSTIPFRPEPPPESPPGDAHLRSVDDILGYTVRCGDDKKGGHVTDFLFDDADWTIRSIELSTTHWPLEHKVLVKPANVSGIHWSRRTLQVRLTAKQLRALEELREEAQKSGHV